MRIEFDPRLIEESVFLALREDARDVRVEAARYHRLADPIYTLADPDERDAAFAALYRETFLRLGLQRASEESAQPFSSMNAGLQSLVLAYSHSRKDEEAELYCNPRKGFTAMLRVRPETLICADDFKRLAFHEFSHIDDMANPDFGYTPSLEIAGLNAEQKAMVRDRYRVLWDIYIDARLKLKALPGKHARQWHELNFLRFFGASETTEAIFSRLWDGGFMPHTTNQTLIDAATNPEGLACWAQWEKPEAVQAAVRRFATVCPFCECPTIDWVQEPGRLDHAIVERVKQKVPAWTPDSGLCNQCVEYLNIECAAAAGTGA